MCLEMSSNKSLTSLYRFIAAHFQTHIICFFYTFISLTFFLAFGGFILPKRKTNIIIEKYIYKAYISFSTYFICYRCVPASMPGWLSWGFWMSPLTYAEISTALNEFLAPRWQMVKYLLR